ncbi:MAG: hydroxymethylglutaryl-CoA lyase [Planctomycetota bacterium]
MRAVTDRVRITDVSPRDGLQNEPGAIPTARKADLVSALAQARVDEVEVTSFVSPRWVPQLGDAAELCNLIAPSKPEGIVYSALVPNERGLDRLFEVNDASKSAHGAPVINKASVFTAASETFSQKNTNATIAETIERFVPVVKRAHEQGLPVRGYVSCVVRCPFEGDVQPSAVADVCARLLDMGIDELDLGDTIGAATRESLGALLDLIEKTPGVEVGKADRFTLHLHDTQGLAADCARLAMSRGVRSFDASAGGLGGCPYASTPGNRAPGNLATGGLLWAIGEEGFIHGVDADALGDASVLAEDLRRRASS